MCLINFQFHEHPYYKLIVAANRDEFYNRPTASAHFWNDEPTILAGRDLEQMGTWLGITKQGRFAALTNYRNPAHMASGKTTRGEIITNYLTETSSPWDFIATIHENKVSYNGFNLILGNPDQLVYYNNIDGNTVDIPPGTHGLSNHFLNTPWPKVTKGKEMLHNYVIKHEVIQVDKLFAILSNEEVAEDVNLPETGIDLELERQLSPLFIKTEQYGTRCSTVLLIDHENNLTFLERTFNNGLFIKEKKFEFQIIE